MQNAIQWFPGHMKKAQRLIESNLKNVNIIIEILDARAPKATSNPLIEKLKGKKINIKILNKCDLADEKTTNEWISFLKKQNIKSIAINGKKGDGIDELIKTINENIKTNNNKVAKNKARCMVLGVPNVGKSSLINKIIGQNKAKVENRPGVTRDLQWLRINNNLELLDMPGLTWNKFEDQEDANILAIIAAIKEEVVDIEEVAAFFIGLMLKIDKEQFENYYDIKTDDIETVEDEDSLIDKDVYKNYEILKAIAKKRGYLLKGKEVDTKRASKAIISDYNNKKIGRISLQSPKDMESSK